jgi:protein ImuA
LILMSLAHSFTSDSTISPPARQRVQLPALSRAGLHEFYAASEADSAATGGFALASANQLLSKTQSLAHAARILWARHDLLQSEAGSIYPPGLLEFGISPGTVTLVRTRSPQDTLQAGLDAARCSALAIVLVEFWGEARIYNLTASQRLAFAAKSSGTALFILRHRATPLSSAAETRWSVKSLMSRSTAYAPGRPAFEITLLRHRTGAAGQTWSVEWNRETRSFEDASEVIQRNTAISRHLAAIPSHREVPLRRTG